MTGKSTTIDYANSIVSSLFITPHKYAGAPPDDQAALDDLIRKAIGFIKFNADTYLTFPVLKLFTGGSKKNTFSPFPPNSCGIELWNAKTERDFSNEDLSEFIYDVDTLEELYVTLPSGKKYLTYKMGCFMGMMGDNEVNTLRTAMQAKGFKCEDRTQVTQENYMNQLKSLFTSANQRLAIIEAEASPSSQASLNAMKSVITGLAKTAQNKSRYADFIFMVNATLQNVIKASLTAGVPGGGGPSGGPSGAPGGGSTAYSGVFNVADVAFGKTIPTEKEKLLKIKEDREVKKQTIGIADSSNLLEAGNGISAIQAILASQSNGSGRQETKDNTDQVNTNRAKYLHSRLKNRVITPDERAELESLRKGVENSRSKGLFKTKRTVQDRLKAGTFERFFSFTTGVCNYGPLADARVPHDANVKTKNYSVTAATDINFGAATTTAEAELKYLAEAGVVTGKKLPEWIVDFNDVIKKKSKTKDDGLIRQADYRAKFSYNSMYNLPTEVKDHFISHFGTEKDHIKLNVASDPTKLFEDNINANGQSDIQMYMQIDGTKGIAVAGLTTMKFLVGFSDAKIAIKMKSFAALYNMGDLTNGKNTTFWRLEPLIDLPMNHKPEFRMAEKDNGDLEYQKYFVTKTFDIKDNISALNKAGSTYALTNYNKFTISVVASADLYVPIPLHIDNDPATGAMKSYYLKSTAPAASSSTPAKWEIPAIKMNVDNQGRIWKIITDQSDKNKLTSLEVLDDLKTLASIDSKHAANKGRCRAEMNGRKFYNNAAKKKNSYDRRSGGKSYNKNGIRKQYKY